MKVLYRGHEIDVHKAKSMGGDVLTYMSIFRLSDGYECHSDFTCGTDTVWTLVKLLKGHVDEELRSPDPWCEIESKAQLARPRTT